MEQGLDMNENFIAVAEALDLTRDDIITLARHAIEISFLSPHQKEQKARELEDYATRADG
jgi:adenosine deaminase